MSATVAVTVGPLNRRRRIDPRLMGLFGTLGVIAVWWILAAGPLAAAGTVPTPAAVIGQLATDGFAFYWTNASVTMLEAMQGYGIGVGLGLLAAAVALVIPVTERFVVQLAVISYCVPIVAIGPIVYLLVGAPRGGAPSGTAIVLAAFAVFFTTVVNALLGFRSADRRALDLVTAYGGGAVTRLRKVQLFSALPSIFSALKIAAPGALLGAILGEYVGGVDRGLGAAMVNAQQNMDVERTWAVALIAAAIAGGSFALIGGLEWIARRGGLVAEATTAGFATDEALRGRGGWRAIAWSVLTVVVLVGLWDLALRVFDVSPFVGKSPLDVAAFFFTAEDAASNRAQILAETATTLGHAAIGFTAGLGVAIIVAMLFVLIPALEFAIMPLAMMMRSVPLVALAPIVILIFGRDIMTLSVIGGLVVFFPALVNLTMGLRSTPPQMTDLISVYGGGGPTVMRMVRIPAALPALFSSIRIAIPGAIGGALLAEWLATGNGLGYGIVSAIGRSDNTFVWACVVAITVSSLLLYGLASILERVARRHWGG